MAKTEKGTVYLMTDKENTKDVPCTHVECFNICRVTKFYSDAKARCPDHGGVAHVKGSGGDFEEFPSTAIDTVEVEITPNQKLRSLMCPICETDEPLEILATTEDGHIDFGCQECWMIVSFAFNWKPLQVRSIPERLKPLVKEFNVKQVFTMDLQVARELSKFGH